MEDPDKLLTTPEYARERKCSERTIERERTSGAGCKYVKLGRSVRYRRRDILDFIARHVRGSTSEPASSSDEDIVDACRASCDITTEEAINQRAERAAIIEVSSLKQRGRSPPSRARASSKNPDAPGLREPTKRAGHKGPARERKILPCPI